MKLGRARRRALSTVVTGGILLSAVAIMGSGLVTWSNSNFATHQNELNNAYNDGVNRLNEFLTIENVWFGNNPSKFLNITLTNSGNSPLNVTKITLDDSIDKVETTFTGGGIVSNDNFSTEITYDWKLGNSIQITVITEKGTQYRTHVMGP